MKLDPLIIALPVYLLLMAVEWIVLKKKSVRSYRANDTITNINCGITSQVIGVFLRVFLVGVYTLIYENLRVMTVPTTALTYFLLFLGFDFCYYWMHRFSHEVNLFWAGHSVHHQSEEYNFSVALRQSSTQIIWTFFFYFPLAILGFDPVQFITVAGINLLYQFWIHTELIQKMPRWFEFVFNTPSHHRVHHAKNPKYIDRNHAGTLILWDRLFGTFKAEEERPVYGITKSLKSWNPVWANLAHYKQMYQDAKDLDSWKDRLQLVFAKPGWRPKYAGGMQYPVEIDTNIYQKHDTQIGFGQLKYVVFQYVLLLIVTAFYFVNQEVISLDWKIVFSVAILLSIISLGLILENRSYALFVERGRLIILFAFVVMGRLSSALKVHEVCFGILILAVFFFWTVYLEKELSSEQ